MQNDLVFVLMDKIIHDMDLEVRFEHKEICLTVHIKHCIGNEEAIVERNDI